MTDHTEHEAWVGNCHFVASNGSDEYRCMAAAWTNSTDSFRKLLIEQGAAVGYKIVWIEEALSATQHLNRHGHSQEIGRLARAVHPQNIVEFGRPTRHKAEPEHYEYLGRTDLSFFPLKDQSTIPSWDREWIAPKLKEILFGQTPDQPMLNTFLILDADLRKKVTGLFDLDEDIQDLPIKSLFNGKSAEQLRENAPYIIDLTLSGQAFSDNSLVSSFHKDFFTRHWDQGTGILIRTHDDLDQVRNHFRKFTRVTMEDDKRWVYFRFYDPRILPAFIEALEENDLHKFAGPHEILCPDIEDSTCLKHYRATMPIGDNQRATLPSFTMKKQYLGALSVNREQSFKVRLEQHLKENVRAFNELPHEEQSKRLEQLIKQALEHGIKVELAVANFVNASLLIGQDLMLDTQLSQIIMSPKNQIDKSRLLLAEAQQRTSPKVRTGAY